MKISSPPGMRYPCTIQALQKKTGAKVRRGDKLFTYYYEETLKESDKWGVEHKATHKRHQHFDATAEGEITRWLIKPGALLERPG